VTLPGEEHLLIEASSEFEVPTAVAAEAPVALLVVFLLLLLLFNLERRNSCIAPCVLKY